VYQFYDKKLNKKIVNKEELNISNNIQSITIDFNGPLKFHKGEYYLYNTDFLNSEGIYIWTIKNEKNGNNYVHYVGETASFGKRQKEHLIQMAGLNYRIIDADFARQGIEKIIWNGLWRDKSTNAVATLLENYNEVANKVIDYIRLINIYFAPTTFEKHIRRHVEGCLGWNLRNKYSNLKTFYPDDNHVGTKADRLGKKLIVNLPEPILGIDRELLI